MEFLDEPLLLRITGFLRPKDAVSFVTSHARPFSLFSERDRKVLLLKAGGVADAYKAHVTCSRDRVYTWSRKMMDKSFCRDSCLPSGIRRQRQKKAFLGYLAEDPKIFFSIRDPISPSFDVAVYIVYTSQWRTKSGKRDFVNKFCSIFGGSYGIYNAIFVRLLFAMDTGETLKPAAYEYMGSMLADIPSKEDRDVLSHMLSTVGRTGL